MHDLLNQLSARFDEPTTEDVERAKEELQAFQGGYVSQTPHLYGIQVKAQSMVYVARRMKEAKLRGIQKAPAPVVNHKAMEEKRKIEVLMGYASIYSNALWSDSDKCWHTDIVQWLRCEYAPSNKPNALLLGGTGCGKTFAAVAYVAHKSWLSEGHLNASFVTAYKLAEYSQRRNYNQIDHYENVRFLIVDDLGAEAGAFKGADFVAYFTNLFATRHAHGRKTLITSNGSLEETGITYGERFVSRFRESGMVYVSDGDDMRVT